MVSQEVCNRLIPNTFFFNLCIILIAVDARPKVSEYEYNVDKLEIIDLMPTRTISFKNANKCILQVSYSVSYCSILVYFSFHTHSFLLLKIPLMYDCVLLRNKLIQVTLLIDDPKEKRCHPVYQLMGNEGPVDSIYYLPTSNSST
jgi:hypothetical protein